MSRQGEQQDAAGRMTIWSLLRNILPYVLPYRWLVAVTLVLTLIGSLMAQVNAVVLDRAVDSINALEQGRVVQSGTPSDVYRQGGLYKEIFDASARSMNVDKIASTIDF